jgi:hypothetical protein
MRNLGILALLIVILMSASACSVAIKDSGETTLKSFESDIMRYDSVNQASNKDGIVNNMHTLVGQAKYPAQTTVTKQVPVTVPGYAQAPPKKRHYGRRAKAVPRTPPPCPPKTVMKTVVETSTTYRGPEVLATSSANGPSTAHDVAAGLAVAIPQAAGMATFGAMVGPLRRPDKFNVSQNGGGGTGYGGGGGTGYGGAGGKGGTGYGGAGGAGGAGGSSSSSAGASASNATAVNVETGSGGHGGGCH